MASNLAPLLQAVICTTLLQLCFIPTATRGFVSAKSYVEDKITSLPGQPAVEFQQFGGYIPVDEQQQRFLFYYFIEAETDPKSKPLVLFLQGGPGCSTVGVEGFGGSGPFRPNGNGLVRNRYSWNKEANMLYVDSPAGVGFSYSTNKSFYEFVNDEITARDNLQFLLNWLTRFPHYKNRDLFLAGASYAGHFVPQLANLLLQSHLKSSLQGIALASPLLQFDLDFNSRAEYFWSHGLISDSTYNSLTKHCNFSKMFGQQIRGEISPTCSQVNASVYKEFGIYISNLDISADICLINITAAESQHEKDTKEENESPDPCSWQRGTAYLNRKDVQRALNAKLVGVDEWLICDGPEKYDLLDIEVPSLPLLSTLVKSGVRVMVYSGDQDPIIPLTASRTHINKLAKELELNTTVPYQSWLQDKKVGGWTQVYGEMLAFATIRGAGHEPPHSQPERTLIVFSYFLQGKALPVASS